MLEVPVRKEQLHGVPARCLMSWVLRSVQCRPFWMPVCTTAAQLRYASAVLLHCTSGCTI